MKLNPLKAAATGANPALPVDWSTTFPDWYTLYPGQEADDYSRFLSLWQSRTGLTPTEQQANAFLNNFRRYAATLGRTPTPTDLLRFATLYLRQTAAPPLISYINVAEI